MTDLTPIFLKSAKLSLVFTLLQLVMIYLPYFLLLTSKTKKTVIRQLLFFKYSDFIFSGIYLFIMIFVFELSGVTNEESPFVVQHPFIFLLLQGIAIILANSFFIILFPILLKKQTNRLEPLPQYSLLLKEKFNADIPVYTTKGKFLNAFAMGILPQNKLIILGSELIANCDKNEMEAILYHEYAHHKNRDLIRIYILIACSGLFFVFFREGFISFLKSAAPWLSGYEIAVYGGLNGLIFWCILFSRISHNAEYKADSFSARQTGDNAMILALQKLSILTGHLIDKGGVTHPSLEKRIENIEKI